MGLQRGWSKSRVSTMTIHQGEGFVLSHMTVTALGLMWHFNLPQKSQVALLMRRAMGTSTSHIFKSPVSLSATEAPPFLPFQKKYKKTVCLVLLRGTGGSLIAPCQTRETAGTPCCGSQAGGEWTTLSHKSVLQRGGWRIAERLVSSYKPRGSWTQQDFDRKSIIKNKLGKRLPSIWPKEQKTALVLEQEQVYNPGK